MKSKLQFLSGHGCKAWPYIHSSLQTDRRVPKQLHRPFSLKATLVTDAQQKKKNYLVSYTQ